ncbi:TonB-dependent receptor [Sphingobium nicotianae]|uniref:TonB-dependent receptor n=1 Tax=Sphingobium nicotianae TaxID=2782607 RepID=A0A9X1IQB0_9SPHN|nr:TonB-dependent receptor [Sphingobium nicotianae]MBT2186539.1 TonB-dependent receptor [Sphingobium nicotianae]
MMSNAKFRLSRLGGHLLAGSCLLIVAALPNPASAQDSARTAGATSSDTEAETGGIEEIVVTARFVSENLQDTPIAITAQTAGQLDAANVSNIGTLGAVVPNLQTVPGDQQSAGTPRVSLRGVQQGSTSSLAVPPAIAIYTDDIYHGTTAGSDLDFTDVSRIEINRGPQSTLSGNASIGGSIKLYTVDPKGDGSGYLQAVGGSRKKMGLSGALDLALSRTLAMRLSGNFEQQQGFGNRLDFSCMMDKLGTPSLKGKIPYFQPDSANRDCIIGHTGGGRTAVGQVKLRWQPNSDIDLLLTARHREDDLEETPEVILKYFEPCISGLTGPQPCADAGSKQSYSRAIFNTFGVLTDNRFLVPQRNGGIYDSYSTYCRPILDTTGANLPAGYPTGLCFSPNKTSSHTLVSGKLSANLAANLHMTAILGYTDYSNSFTQSGDESPLANSLNNFINIDKQTSAELRFDGKLFNDKLNWVVGGFAMRLIGYQNNTLSYQNIYQYSKVRGVNESKSVFFHLDYNLTDRWRVSGGARYTDTQIAITIDNPQQISVLAPVVSGQKRKDWLISTDYKITDHILAYASAASGSRPPGLTTIVNTPRQLAPTSAEDLISYELGLKADLLDRRLRTNLTAFYLDYRQLATSIQGTECRNQPGATATFFNVVNLSPAAITTCSQFPGVPDPITFFLNLGIPAKVKGIEWDITAVPVEGLRIDWTGGYNHFASGITAAGQPGYLAPGNLRQPEWNMHANLSYDVHTSLGTFTPRLDWNWQSRQTFDPSPATRAPFPQFVIEPYSLWNAQVAYEAPDRGWTATLSVTNLDNKWYHYQLLEGTLNQQTRVAAPREFAVTVKRTF